MNGRVWFWRFSVAVCGGAILLVTFGTWVPAQQAIRTGTATRDLLLVAGTYLFALLFISFARLVRNGGSGLSDKRPSTESASTAPPS